MIIPFPFHASASLSFGIRRTHVLKCTLRAPQPRLPSRNMNCFGYNRLKYILFIALLLIPCGQVFAKTTDALQVEENSRIRLLSYDETNVYVIRTKYGYQTNIVFSPQEEIQTISVGDRSLWQIIPAGNRLYIRPLTENITTNMTLITNKNSYEFDLKSVSRGNESNIYVAKFEYPPKVAVAPQPPITQPQINTVHTLKLPQKAGQNNYNYTYSGADSLAPQQVYDNGKSVFINYQTLKSPPEVFIVAGGKEFLTTPTIKGNSLIINDLAGEIMLRNSDGEVHIYNESLSAGSSYGR